MKRIVTIILTLMLVFTSTQTAYAKEKKYHYIYDATNAQVIDNTNGDTKIYPASMTKIMSVYTALKKINNLDEKVKVLYTDTNQWLAQDAAVAGFIAGSTPTYRDLLYGAMYPSGADACYILARSLCGSEESFVEEMNKNASLLGMTHTHFTNTTGLHDDNHYSTCHDMQRVLNAAYKNEVFRTIFTGTSYTASTGLSFVSTLKRYEIQLGIKATDIIGAKSGSTTEAKYCLASVMKHQGHTIFCVVAKSERNGVLETNELTSDIVNNMKLVNVGDVYKSFYFLNSDDYKETVEEKDLEVFVDKKYKTINTEWAGSLIKVSPVKQGEKIAALQIKSGDRLLSTIEYNATINHNYSRMAQMAVLAVGIIVLFIILCIIRFIRKKLR